MSAAIYRVTGDVVHPDGSSYSPLYWGALPTARFVLDAVVDSAVREGSGFDLTLDQGDSGVYVCRRYRPLPAAGYSRAPFALVVSDPRDIVREVRP